MEWPTSGSHSLPSSMSREICLACSHMSGSVTTSADAVAGEGELAGELAVRVLVDDAADVVRIEAREHPVHHHLRDRDLAALGLAARFEIDRLGEALLGLGALPSGRGRAARPASSAACRGRSPRPWARRLARAVASDVAARQLAHGVGSGADVSAERLMSGSIGRRRLDQQFLVLGPGLDRCRPFSPTGIVAEIEPAQPLRRVGVVDGFRSGVAGAGCARCGGDSDARA